MMGSASHTTRRWVLNEHAEIGGKLDLTKTFRLESSPSSDYESQGEGNTSKILVKTKYLSNAPGLRVLVENTPEERRFAPVHILGAPIRMSSVVEVIKSCRPEFREGQLLTSMLGWVESEWLDPDLEPQFKHLPPNCSPTDFFSLSCETLAAHIGLLKVGKATSNDKTIIVTAAAGATGSMVCQIAKNVLGIKTVIGVAGCSGKCDILKAECGCDIALNYNDPRFVQNLGDATPDYIDLFFDNVGGSILDRVVRRMAMRGRIVSCGSVSSYNNSSPEGGLALSGVSWRMITTLRLNIQGFILFDHSDSFASAQEDIQAWVGGGKLQVIKDIYQCKFEEVPEALAKLFKGDNVGSLVTELIE